MPLFESPTPATAALATGLIQDGTVRERFAPKDPRAQAFAAELADAAAVALIDGAPESQTVARFVQGLVALSETPYCVPAAEALRELLLLTGGRRLVRVDLPVLSDRLQDALKVAILAQLDQGQLLIHEVVRVRQAWATPLNGPTPTQPPRRSPRP